MNITPQERLMAYASRKLFGHLTPREFSRPWTYVHREWREDGKRCAECIAVGIDREDGTKLRVTMADMLGESQQRLPAPRPPSTRGVERLPYVDPP